MPKMTGQRISIIVAHSQNMAIGKGNSLLWKLPGDMKRFVTLTMGHPVVMGRKTWESIPEKFRPLQGRTNLVITGNPNYNAPGAKVCYDLKSALKEAGKAKGAEEVFIIGGGEIYKQSLPIADRLYATQVEEEVEGDTYFPEYSELFKTEISREPMEHDGLKFQYVTLDK